MSEATITQEHLNRASAILNNCARLHRNWDGEDFVVDRDYQKAAQLLANFERDILAAADERERKLRAALQA